MGDSALSPGSVFAGYTIEAVIGSGAMGTLYRAQHPNPAPQGRPQTVEHPNIVVVHDRGRVGDPTPHLARR